ncbi:MAG TPA: inorganic phosphate transporter, partial [Nitrospiria bacterium]
MNDPVLLIGAFLVGLLAFANGSNDVSKGIATLVGSGVADVRAALRWGTFWTFIGGLLGLVFSLALVKTFTKGVLAVPMEAMSAAVPLAVTLGAIGWVLAASRISMPVSTTHAITGALCGTGLAAWGMNGVQWITLSQKIILPLAVSPLLALGLTFLVFPGVRKLMKDWKGHCFCLLPTR